MTISVKLGRYGAEKRVSFLEHHLHFLELSQLAGLAQPQPAVSVLLVGGADLHITILHLCQPVDDGLELLPGHITELPSEPLKMVSWPTFRRASS